MSYWVYLECTHCHSDLFSANMTSNVSGMWDTAGAPLRDWGGRVGIDVLQDLQHAIDELKDLCNVEYDAMTPENGWGSRAGCVEFLERLRTAICRNPHAALRVSH